MSKCIETHCSVKGWTKTELGDEDMEIADARIYINEEIDNEVICIDIDRGSTFKQRYLSIEIPEDVGLTLLNILKERLE